MPFDISEALVEELTHIRHHLHANPELSGEEKNTAQFICKKLHEYGAHKVVANIGGYGIIAVYEGKEKGPNIGIRADFDALPIEDKIDQSYRSNYHNVGHKCGHDGHTTCALGVAAVLKNNPPQKGKVTFIFQPAEETGMGARSMMNDEKFNEYKPDFLFGQHNLPKAEKKRIYVKPKTFCAASIGMSVEFTGKTSHAAEPDKGRSPALALADMLHKAKTLNEDPTVFKDFTLITPIHAKLGEVAFGTTPGKAVVKMTLRSYKNRDLERAIEKMATYVKFLSNEYELSYAIDYTDHFEANKNDKAAYDKFIHALEEAAINFEELKEPIRWSEDFGHFSGIMKTCFFAVGSGEETAPLHDEKYDYPDEITPSAIRAFLAVLKTHNF